MLPVCMANFAVKERRLIRLLFLFYFNPHTHTRKKKNIFNGRSQIGPGGVYRLIYLTLSLVHRFVAHFLQSPGGLLEGSWMATEGRGNGHTNTLYWGCGSVVLVCMLHQGRTTTPDDVKGDNNRWKRACYPETSCFAACRPFPLPCPFPLLFHPPLSVSLRWLSSPPGFSFGGFGSTG